MYQYKKNISKLLGICFFSLVAAAPAFSARLQSVKTKYFEIDIISKLDNSLFFTEVKYRKTTNFGEPIEFVDQRKQEQVRFAAESYLAMHPEFKDFTAKLAVAGVSGKVFQVEDWMVID